MPVDGGTERKLRPAIEALLVFAAFWLDSILPLGSGIGASLSLPGYHLALFFHLAPKALLLLYLMSRLDGLEAYKGLSPPRAADLYRALLTMAGAFAIALAFSGLAALLRLGVENPLLSGVARPSAPAFILVPAILLSCTAVGYAEELYFRVYLLKRLGEAGLEPVWAAAASTLLFAGAHGGQGAVGLVMAFFLGAWFCFRRIRGSGLHELAWAHAAYDAAVMLITLYLA